MAVIGTKDGYGVNTRNTGLQPALREELLLRDKAMSGDMVITPSLTTYGMAATTATQAWSKAVTWRLKTAGGKLHDWFCGHMKAAIVDSATTGVAHISGGVDTTIYFNGGVTVITLAATTGPFNAGNTLSLRVWREDLLGNPVSTASFVITFA